MSYRVTQFYSGLKVLSIANDSVSKKIDEELVSTKFYDRYELIESEELNELLKEMPNNSVLSKKLVFDNYYNDDFFSRLVRVICRNIKLSFIQQMINYFYIIYCVWKLTHFKIVVGINRKSLEKSIASELVKVNVAFILVSSDNAILKYVLLKGAIKSRIPIIFLSRSFSSDKVNALINHAESAAHNSIRHRQGSEIKSIAEIYGAKTIVAAYCGLPKEAVHIPGFWTHGWIPAYHNVHPALIALHKREKSGIRFSLRDHFNTADRQLVTRMDQEIFLREHGYANVKTIGHPVVYMKLKKLPRIEGSLLVVPPRGGGWRSENDSVVKQYVEYIYSLKPKFSFIQVCVTVDDYIRRNWWPAFQKANIGNFVSVDRSNPNANYRLFKLLSQFEYVTTNGFGSIIAYAAFTGCKTSVSGPYAEVPAGLLKKTHAVIHYPELLEKKIELCSKIALQTHYPEMFVEPEHAIERIEWGRHELGYEQRLSSEEIRALVG